MIHVPVLLNEAVELLHLSNGMKVVDCTLGAGGHAEAILSKISPNGRLLAIDRDQKIADKARQRLKKYDNLIIHVGSFSDLLSIAKDNCWEGADAVLFDLGVSSFQLDDDKRGFSYMHDDASLDMRMADDLDVKASDVLNNYSEADLARLFREYGDIKKARTLTKRIISLRRAKPFLVVKDLKDAISGMRIGPNDSRNFMARVWQALRMEVNDEVGQLRQGLQAAFQLLSVGGRLAVISFHSVEDRMVKDFFREKSRLCICPKELPKCVCRGKREMQVLTKKPIVPSKKEISLNIRSKSAKLRVASKQQEDN